MTKTAAVVAVMMHGRTTKGEGRGIYVSKTKRQAIVFSISEVDIVVVESGQALRQSQKRYIGRAH